MALGLGQNWKRVRCVVHVGRGDPSSICQMIGRCGRGDNNPGLGIMFVETNRRSGKNKIIDFVEPFKQSDDDRMDALGYIPLDQDDPNVRTEKLREEEKNFTTCLCSNCDPEGAKNLVEGFKYLTTDNFAENITSRNLLFDIPVSMVVPKATTTQSPVKADTGKEPLDEELETFAEFLVSEFAQFHYTQINPEYSEFEPEEHFAIFEAQRVVVGFCGGVSNKVLEDLVGGGAHDTQMVHLLERLKEYTGKASYLDYVRQLEVEREQAEEEKRKKVAARNEATLERRRQKAEETKRKNVEKAEANKRQRLMSRTKN
ncbi:hypothetical protein PSTG_07819 [Puccinia striiformis f. sp. tritici PST-78]|uniref:Helicase C-terminal domain-containing protein n=1 Tax=Puccinia striiformis f. sp. tritici PST-78 TaxID=1165861 RepID=A0A0L0VI75_9BASI|nr:hypothetical protein PSTG_07819 [Puccinia striiformis f. sp. tritici PST-78]